MREPKIALRCTPIEPDQTLLEQMTMLAAASTAPARSSWWQRVATKSGAAAIAGVLALSGAAYAERGELAPMVKAVTGVVHHHAPHRHPVHVVPTVAPTTSAVVLPSPQESPSASDHADNGRRAHGFHAKRGQGAGWTKRNGDQAQSQGNDNGQGNGNAYGRKTDRPAKGNQNGNQNSGSQGVGHGKKTGQNGGSQGNHNGWAHSKGASNSQN